MYVNDADGQHILTYWQHLAGTLSIMEKFKAKTLAFTQRTTPMTDIADLTDQIADLSNEIDTLNHDSAILGLDFNESIYKHSG